MSDALTPEAFEALTGVSRETMDRLALYAETLRKWQGAINLVGPATLADLWRRHFLDSAQLVALIPAGTRRLVDLGSGAGFPGLVLAVLGVPEVHLLESDGRKAIFLRETARALGVTVTVHANRAEAVVSLGADVVTARALAPLDRLLALARPHLAAERGCCLFLKGAEAEQELTRARKTWMIRVERFPSLTDPRGSVLRLREISG